MSHDAQRDIYDLTATGNLPSSFSLVRDQLVADQNAAGGTSAGVDYVSDIPLALAEGLCGYRHDGFEFSWGTPEFFILKKTLFG
ncbi:MAG: hypothetical protein HY054_16300 [Proteobacteria bacterium]|nr:hypothetical protein [Pseudomonadota bacterium]